MTGFREARLRLWDDNPTSTDLLGFYAGPAAVLVHFTALVEVVKHASQSCGVPSTWNTAALKVCGAETRGRLRQGLVVDELCSAAEWS